MTRKRSRSEEHTSELQSPCNLVCRLLLEKKKKERAPHYDTKSSNYSFRARFHRQFRLVRFFFFNDTATTEIYTLSLHDALPICPKSPSSTWCGTTRACRG